MIDVRVAENDGVDLIRVKREVGVPLAGVFALPLVHAAIEQDLVVPHFDEVHPQLQAWNASHEVWQRRLSLTSLIHYSGKHAVFLRPGPMLALAANCVTDHRKEVEMALGWVLREAGQAHPDAVTAFLSDHAASLSARAYARAIERRAPAERQQLLLARKTRLA